MHFLERVLKKPVCACLFLFVCPIFYFFSRLFGFILCLSELLGKILTSNYFLCAGGCPWISVYCGVSFSGLFAAIDQSRPRPLLWRRLEFWQQRRWGRGWQWRCPLDRWGPLWGEKLGQRRGFTEPGEHLQLNGYGAVLEPTGHLRPGTLRSVAARLDAVLGAGNCGGLALGPMPLRVRVPAPPRGLLGAVRMPTTGTWSEISLGAAAPESLLRKPSFSFSHIYLPTTAKYS